jgi:esterase/lipase superfamily enzyme
MIMFIVSNRETNDQRNDLKAFGSKPNSLGPNELRLAEATRVGKNWRINILPDKITDAMAKEVGLQAEIDAETNEPKTLFASRYVARKLLFRANPALNGAREGGRNLVFFVHGFNNDLEAVLDRAENLEKSFGVEVLPFTWPANGGGIHGVTSYKSDKRDVLVSTGALDRCFGKIFDCLHDIHREHIRNIQSEAAKRFPTDAEKQDRFLSVQAEERCSFTVNLLLHSMGNYLFKNLLKSSNYRGDLLIFDNVIMAAADTNNEGHAEWVDRIQCRGRAFITINEKDGALRASRIKMGEQQKARLGHYPFQLTSRRATYVNFTDAQNVGDSHAYFEGEPIKNGQVMKFFADALNGASAERELNFDLASNMYHFQ